MFIPTIEVDEFEITTDKWDRLVKEHKDKLEIENSASAAGIKSLYETVNASSHSSIH